MIAPPSAAEKIIAQNTLIDSTNLCNITIIYELEPSDQIDAIIQIIIRQVPNFRIFFVF